MLDKGYIVRTLSCILLCATGIFAQQISGSLTGVVKDSQQASVINAKVTLSNPQQGTTRDATTGTDGAFVITQLQPGTYNLSVEATGFKKMEQKDVRVSANDRVSIGDIVLTVGALSETITVESTASQVQTASAERSGVLTNRQVVDLAATGRSLFDLTKTLPGIVYTGGLGGVASNGNRNNQNNFTLDGVTNVDTGSNGGTLATTNIDMIAEMKVITNSQPAEFGRSSGAQIEVVTKSGSKDFHGTTYWFHRHDSLNANTWRNNIDNRARPFYRYNFYGFNVGGPAYIPGKFNRDKNKFFFFVGIEWQKQLIPNELTNVTVPTSLERTGDFSQSHDGGGAALVIKDPLNNGIQFPGNVIPKNRLNPDGVKILGFYPQPNALGKDPGFNYQSQVSNTYPRREDVYRGDYNISDKWKVYGRYINNKDETSMAYGQWNAQYNIPFGPMSFGAPGWSIVANVTTIINPTLTNEFVFGSSKNVLHIYPLDNAFDASPRSDSPTRCRTRRPTRCTWCRTGSGTFRTRPASTSPELRSPITTTPTTSRTAWPRSTDLTHSRAASTCTRAPREELRGLRATGVFGDSMNVLRRLVERLTRPQCHFFPTLHLHRNRSLQHIHKRVSVMSVLSRRPPGAYSTVSIMASLLGIPIRSFVISGVTVATSAAVAAAARHSASNTIFMRFLSLTE